MKKLTPVVLICGLAPWFVAWMDAAEYQPDLAKELGFPIYKNSPPGKQLSGAYAPSTTPALAPQATQKLFKVPAGFEVRLFASEPEVVNPVAMVTIAWGGRMK